MLGAPDMIDMCVAHDGIFDPRRIEAELLEPADDLVLDRIGPDRIDDDDAVGGDDRPGGVFLLADVVEIVEYLDRLIVPGGALRHRSRPGRPLRRTGGGRAESVEQ